MLIRCPAIVCSVLLHGEHGAVVRALTPEDGLVAGYVRGGRSRRIRPILSPGNLVAAEYRARTEDQLPALTVELSHSRAGLLAEPLPAAAIDWLCALTAVALPEREPFPDLYQALEAALAAVEYAPSARGWALAALRYEMLVVAGLGYGAGLMPPAEGADWPDILNGWRQSGRLLSDDILSGRRASALDARERLIERVKRIAT
ncbi:DNA repair protein RecO [Sphingomonas crocodyli]|uniref:DNA repair protein RecO n=1 Tax=Sphingomonas crocodyli TaxID=1979270 RepID=A0A437M9L8_9SPHN|nr:recombination protein O N-terminal domain-containing protein [Sphingomonas crocodyli]RVT94401.1 DNA repair protein RecO [Sphingomonas crocodyli]